MNFYEFKNFKVAIQKYIEKELFLEEFVNKNEQDILYKIDALVEENKHFLSTEDSWLYLHIIGAGDYLEGISPRGVDCRLAQINRFIGMVSKNRKVNIKGFLYYNNTPFVIKGQYDYENQLVEENIINEACCELV